MNETNYAFPKPRTEFGGSDGRIETDYGSDGMSLRAHFAGLALQGMIAAAVHRDPPLSMEDFKKHAPRACCEYADALLAELNKTK